MGMKKRTLSDSRLKRQILTVVLAAGLAAGIQEFLLKPGLKRKLRI